MAKISKILIVVTAALAMAIIHNPISLAQQNPNVQTNVQDNNSWQLNFYEPDPRTGTATGSGASIDAQLYPRSFPVPVTPTIPQLPNYWGIITPDGRFQKLADITLFKPDWSYGDADNLSRQKGGKVDVQPIKLSNAGVNSPYLQVIMVRPRDQQEMQKFQNFFQVIGACNIYAKKGASSLKVLGEAVKAGLQMGAEALTYNEGAALELVASSFGIGIGNTVATVPSGAGAAAGTVTGGGLGFSRARAHYATNPWLQVTYYKYQPGKSGFYGPSSLPPGQVQQPKQPRGRTMLPPALQGPAGGNNNSGYPEKPYPEEGRFNTLQEGKAVRNPNASTTIMGQQ